MMAPNPSFEPSIGHDGLSREAPIIAYTEKIIEAEQLQLRKYIEENYSKIRDVERELGNLSMEMKLTAGPKKAALEHLRKKIEIQTERIHVAKQKEEQAREIWEAALQSVKDEEAVKQKLCEDLNNLVKESSSSQFARLEELKRRLEALNPIKVSTSNQGSIGPEMSSAPSATEQSSGAAETSPNQGNGENFRTTNGHVQQIMTEEARGKKKSLFQGRGRGIGAVPKGRGSSASGWTGAGFDVDSRT